MKNKIITAIVLVVLGLSVSGCDTFNRFNRHDDGVDGLGLSIALKKMNEERGK